MSVPHRPVLLLRYEDMLTSPERSFGRLAAFLRLKPDADQLQRAIEKSSFTEMARQEDLHGFNERPSTAEVLPLGKAGQWRKLFRGPGQRHIGAHGPMMMRFGYLAEDCGA